MNPSKVAEPGSSPRGSADESRRGFLAWLLGLPAAGLAVLTPLVTGLIAFLNPLRQKAQAGQAVRLATLDTLPQDGTPVKASVVLDQVDAWNRLPNQPVGAVFLRRTGPTEVAALNVICPHAGGSIEYREQLDPATNQKTRKFFCPLHGANFHLSGQRADALSPSPRDMDPLEVDPGKLQQTGEVWVHFQNFQTGVSDRVPKT